MPLALGCFVGAYVKLKRVCGLGEVCARYHEGAFFVFSKDEDRGTELLCALDLDFSPFGRFSRWTIFACGGPNS